MRNWHYLHRGRAIGWPAQSIALSVVCSTGREQGKIRKASLLGWAARLWRGTEGRAVSESSADGVTAESFWHWLLAVLRKGEQTWIWQLGAIHGLTQLGFWDRLTQGEWRIAGANPTPTSTEGNSNGRGGSGLCLVSDPPTCIIARPRSVPGSARWVDIRNLGLSDWEDLPNGKALTAASGQADDGSNLSGRNLARNRAGSLAQWLAGWYDVVRDLRLGGLRSTAASQAWNGWLHSYLTCVVEAHDEPDRLLAEESAIHGGRCEVFRCSVATAKVYCLDASAFYPGLARANALPARVSRSSKLPETGYVLDADSERFAIARGRVWTDAPCVPCRTPRGVEYPTGTWRATLCWPEIALLLREGGKFRADEIWEYEPADPLGKFVSALWAKRLQCERLGLTAHSQAVKLLMNSLIGKFAGRDHYWQDEPTEFFPCPWHRWWGPCPETGQLTRWRSIGWRVQREVDRGIGAEAVPAVAAWVYSLGRCQLWEWMGLAGPSNVLYVDTDSLWVTEAGYARLQSALPLVPGVLGELRLESESAWARFYGQRWYETPDGIVCAGIPAHTAERTDNGWTYYVPESIPQGLRSWRHPAPTLTRYEVSDRTDYARGRVGKGGKVHVEEVCYAEEIERVRN